MGLKKPTLTVIPWDGGKGGTKEASRRRTARKKGRLQLEFGIKTSQVVQVSPTGHKKDFFSEIGQLAQFEGRALDLLGIRNMQNKAFFLFFQKNWKESDRFRLLSLEEENYLAFEAVSSYPG